MSLVPSNVASGGNLPTDLYFALKGDIPAAQTLSQSGNTISLSGGGGSVNVASTTSVALSTQKLTAITYNTGLLETNVDGVLNVGLGSAIGSSRIEGGTVIVSRGDDLPTVQLTDENTANSGTIKFDGTSFVFNPPIPGGVGPQGPPGPQGIQGVQGIQGEVGPTGPEGPAGPQGPQGNDGPAGPQGVAGPPGPDGPQGIQGVQGEVGPAGPAGPEGLQGLTGAQGPIGPAGPQGETGATGPEGPAGPAGIQGPIGPAGPQGEVGATGPAGPAGIQGPEGPVGPQGLQGIAGPEGPEGPAGPQGIQGIAGPAGPAGPQGEQGPAGQSSSFYNYLADTTVVAPPVANGDIVWNNATQASATELYVSHRTSGNDDIDVLLGLLKDGDMLIIQDQLNSNNNQHWEISGTPVVIPNDYVTFPVTLVSATHSFANNDALLLIASSQGTPGPQGPAGPAGPQGIQGETGPAGPAGPQGETGPQGPIGLTGPQGETGATGPEGPAGPTGPQGPIGLTGPQGETGATGPAGPQGEVGPQGPIGLTGPQGETGATGPEGPAGAQGPQGIQGPQGETGPIGPAGPAGATGETGPAGPPGPQGDPGPTGPEGPQGIQGIQGVQGIQGEIGPQGIQGIQGPQGVPGPIAGTDQQIVFNAAGDASGSPVLLFDYTAKVLTMADVAGSIVLNPANETIAVSNGLGAYSQMGTGGITTSDGGSKSITLLGDVVQFSIDNGAGNTYQVDGEAPNIVFQSASASSTQTPASLNFSSGTNVIDIDVAASPAATVSVTNGTDTTSLTPGSVTTSVGAESATYSVSATVSIPRIDAGAALTTLASPSAGQFLRININGTNYKIALLTG